MTISLEMIFVGLEDQYLGSDEIILLLASSRTHLFRFMVERALQVSISLENGSTVEDLRPTLRRFDEEIWLESVRVLHSIRTEIEDEYLDLLMAAYKLTHYSRWVRPDELELARVAS
jgi:hypothetical protein